MARINVRQLQFEVEKQIGKIPAYRRFATAQAKAVFQEAKAELLAEFDEDPITQEIEEGPDKVGSSLLPGGYGNLFSFLGFYDDEKPIEELRAFLEHNITLVETPITQSFKYLFKVNVPSKEEVAEVTPMPFGTAKSWALAVENGVPGFNQYLFDLEREFAASRSGPAVQVKPAHTLRDTEGYHPEPYLFKKIFPAFKRSLLS